MTKRIEDHTDAELDKAITRAEAEIPHFWTLVHGVHAFFERRKRRDERTYQQSVIPAYDDEGMWGSS
jgi:hypothetical protein